MDRERGREAGMAFFVVTVLALVATVMVGTFLATSLSKVSHVEQEIAERSAFNAAEAGLNVIVAEVWRIYRNLPP
jgi:hypothetical protein